MLRPSATRREATSRSRCDLGYTAGLEPMVEPVRRASDNAGVPSLENFTRVETFGAPNHHWVQVVVSRDDPSVFTFHPRVVEANVQPGSQ